ncbi:MAG: transposase, partial [Candidatus Methylomirabilales bacterium]
MAHSWSGGIPGYVRWSRGRGSIDLLDQKIPIRYQRVRDLPRNAEVPLPTYQRLQQPRQDDAGLFRKLLLGLSCWNYGASADPVPAAFDLSASILSPVHPGVVWKLRRCRNDASNATISLSWSSTPSPAPRSSWIAPGITLTGEKVLLGFVQSATENERGCAGFLRELAARGLQYAQGLLVVIDGAKGLRKTVAT